MAESSLKKQTKKGLLWTFFDKLVNYGLAFVVGIIMARKLAPSDYGLTALPAVFIAIAAIFVESGFGNAMIRKPELADSDLTTSFLYSISVGVFCYLIIFICTPFIADFYKEPLLVPLVRISSLTFLWSPLATPQNILLKRKLAFNTIARINITTRIIGATIGIAAAYIGYGLWSLVIMNLVSSFFSFIQSWIAVKWIPKRGWSSNSFKYLWNFGNKLTASSLLDTVYNNLTPIIVAKYFSTSELGFYNRAKNYADLPSMQGTSIIQSVTFPVLSKLQYDTGALARNYRKMLRVSAFVIFPIMMMLAALATPFIVLLVTDKWIDAVLLLQIMCFSAMWYPIHSINLNLLQVKGRSDLFLKLEFWKKIVGLVFMACTLPFGLVYFVSAGIANSIIALVINTYYTGKLINVGFLTQMRDLIPTLFLSVLMFVVIYGVNQFIDNMWTQLILGLIIGPILYIGMATIFKFPELQDLIYILNINK